MKILIVGAPGQQMWLSALRAHRPDIQVVTEFDTRNQKEINVETMRNLNQMGMIDNSEMERLEGIYRELQDGSITEDRFYQKVGVTRKPGESKHGNKPVSNHMDRKRKRKAQRLARKMSRARV